jgi:transcriptional regulator with XRE-family HTH domain
MARRQVLISPLDIDDEADLRLVGARRREAKLVWLDAPGFGDWICKKREGLNLSLRRAGERIGVSHSYLAVIEQDGGQRPLALDLYKRMAETYDLDEREVLDRAGFRYAVVEEVAERLRDLEAERFARLMLHEDLRPGDFTEKHLELFPPVVRKYIIDLVQNVDDNAREKGPDVLAIMDGEDEDR